MVTAPEQGYRQQRGRDAGRSESLRDPLPVMEEEERAGRPQGRDFCDESGALPGEGVTNKELKTAAVTLFGDATATFENGVLAPADQPDGEIVSCHDGKTLTGSALLVPQDMTGKQLIKVSINGHNFIYTPTIPLSALSSGHPPRLITMTLIGRPLPV